MFSDMRWNVNESLSNFVHSYASVHQRWMKWSSHFDHPNDISHDLWCALILKNTRTHSSLLRKFICWLSLFPKVMSVDRRLEFHYIDWIVYKIYFHERERSNFSTSLKEGAQVSNKQVETIMNKRLSFMMFSRYYS